MREDETDEGPGRQCSDIVGPDTRRTPDAACRIRCGEIEVTLTAVRSTERRRGQT